MLDAKRHVCFLDWSADFLEQSTQMRISFKVEHHESCIHEYIGAVFVYRNRVGVSADVIVLLKKCNVVLFVKPMSTTHSRDSGSDDCQFFHSRSACFGKQIMAYNPFFTFIEAPQFGTRHIENAPENPPFHCLIFSIRFFKQGHNCIFVGVHSLARGFGSFLIVCPAYVLVFGTLFQKTSEAWLQRMDANKDAIMPLFEETYGKDQAVKWWVFWRIFYMSCAELWGFNKGEEWIVSHYLFSKTR